MGIPKPKFKTFRATVNAVSAPKPEKKRISKRKK